MTFDEALAQLRQGSTDNIYGSMLAIAEEVERLRQIEVVTDVEFPTKLVPGKPVKKTCADSDNYCVGGNHPRQTVPFWKPEYALHGMPHPEE